MSTIFPHPVLHSHTLDYSDPKAYQATFRRKDKIILEVQHTLARDTLVASLIEKKDASFYCTVSVRGTAFRRTKSTVDVNVQDDRVTACQEIELPAFKNRPEVFAFAGIFNHNAQMIPWREAKGVDNFHKPEDWADINFPSHSILAYSGWIRFFPMDALFQIKSDPNITQGVFTAETSYNPTIRITISMHNKLFDEVESNPNSSVRAHVLCASLIPTLKELQGKYEKFCDGGDPDETESTDLEAAEGLKQYLISEKIPTWEDEGFDPVEAASRFKPAMLGDEIEST